MKTELTQAFRSAPCGISSVIETTGRLMTACLASDPNGPFGRWQLDCRGVGFAELPLGYENGTDLFWLRRFVFGDFSEKPDFS